MSLVHYYDKTARELHAAGKSGFEGEHEAEVRLMDGLCELSAEIDRLNDLRRWRPMEEHPAAVQHVLARRRDRRRSVSTVAFTPEGWIGDEGRLTYLDGWEWTYIPGSEPEVPRG